MASTVGILASDVSSNLELLRNIEKLGGSAAYEKSLEGPEGDTSSLIDALTGESVGAWISIKVAGPAVSMYIDTSDGHSGSGSGWKYGVTQHNFQGVLTCSLPWTVLQGTTNDFTVVDAHGHPGVDIIFTIGGPEVAKIVCPGDGLGDIIGLTGKFNWSRFGALTVQIQRSLQLMKGLEKAGGAAAYEKFLSTPQAPKAAPRPIVTPSYSVSAVGYFGTVGPYIEMTWYTLDAHHCSGQAWGSGVGPYHIEISGTLNLVGGWAALMSANINFDIVTDSSSPGGSIINFVNAGRVVAFLTFAGGFHEFVGLSGNCTWDSSVSTGSDGASATPATTA